MGDHKQCPDGGNGKTAENGLWRPFRGFPRVTAAARPCYGRIVSDPSDHRSELASAARSERFTLPRLGGVHLHALYWGDPSAPPVVLAHGGGANAWWWEHLAPALAISFHVAALDFRGHGESDFPDAIPPGSFQEDLRALLAHLGESGPDAVRPAPVLVGHSMGGEVVLRVAAEAGTKPRGLVLLDLARGRSDRARRVMRRALTIRHAYRSREEAIERFRFLPPAVHAEEALRRQVAARSVHQDPDGRWSFKADPRWVDALPTEAVRPADVTCPTLFLRGSESGVCSEEGAKDLVTALPHARLVTVPRAGHHVHIDAPKATLREIRHFLHELH
jgi:pimeloyl-ACP methyl ester carboxylesterase